MHRNRIMKLHFQGLSVKEIMQDLRQHSDIEPHQKGVWTFISRLKRNGWTAEMCEDGSKQDLESKRPPAHDDIAAAEDEKREFIPLVRENKQAEVLVISSDEEESSDRSNTQRTLSTRSQSARNRDKASSSSCVNRNVDESDLDRCASNDEAVEAVEIDHPVCVCPIQQRSFEDWEELGEYLTAYSRSTYQVSLVFALWNCSYGLLTLHLQVYRMRSTCNVRSRNAEISRTKSGKREDFVPDHFEAYVKRWDCFHDNGTGKRKRDVFKCPAKASDGVNA